MRIALNYGYLSHRFVKTTQVGLKQNGTVLPEASGSKRGSHLWDVTASAGQKLDLELLIPEPAAPNNKLGKPLMDLKQVLEYGSLPKGGDTVTPKNSDPSDKCPDRFNPRLTGQLVGAGPGRRFEINADLAFIDLTAYYRANFPAKMDLYDRMWQTETYGSTALWGQVEHPGVRHAKSARFVGSVDSCFRRFDQRPDQRQSILPSRI